MAPFSPGQPILYRGPHIDDSGLTGPPVICDLKPVVVVEDSPALIALFLPAGTPTLMSRPVISGAPKPWNPDEWELVSGAWDRWNTLYLQLPGEWRSTWVMWSPRWDFLGWYVNLQEPLHRTRWGFDIRDLQLDINVAPNRSWRWKDEDDFQRSIECGLISEPHAALVRESAAAAVAAIESRAYPFDDIYPGWRPDSNWPAPSFPHQDALPAVLTWSPSDWLENDLTEPRPYGRPHPAPGTRPANSGLGPQASKLTASLTPPPPTPAPPQPPPAPSTRCSG